MLIFIAVFFIIIDKRNSPNDIASILFYHQHGIYRFFLLFTYPELFLRGYASYFFLFAGIVIPSLCFLCLGNTCPIIIFIPSSFFPLLCRTSSLRFSPVSAREVIIWDIISWLQDARSVLHEKIPLTVETQQ